MPDDQAHDHDIPAGSGNGTNPIGIRQESTGPVDQVSAETRELAGSAGHVPAAAPTDAASSGLLQAAEGDTSLLREVLAEPPVQDSIPGYQIVREIHRGGQGVIYQAVQRATKRKVAVKVMREGPFASKRETARFEREVEVLGQLNHPHIVNIHDSGVASGSHYFVMDYISGQSLDEWTRARPRTIREILHLFARICEAVNAAHLRGIIHRDLKPGNILIDHEGGPHILDFGLAKVAAGTEASVMTETGQFMGSLPWAAPEQAEAVPAKIDLRTDVYSLGVVLFQMLTGQSPYGSVGSMLELLNDIVKAEPAKPSNIRREIDDDVDTIVLKCLSKERERRYETAGALARDIGHYLGGEIIEAKRDRPLYILRKHLQRYRLPVAVAAGFVLMLATGLLVALILLGQVAKERALAQDRERTAQSAYADGALEEGTALHLAGQGQASRAAFRRARDALTGLGLSPLPSEVGLYRSFREYDAPIQTLSGHLDGLMAVAWLPDGVRACSASEDGTVRLWDVRTGREIRTFIGHAGAVHCLAVSPDGKYILSGGEDRKARLWYVETGDEDPPAFTQTGPVRGVAFSPDGRSVLFVPATTGGAVLLGDVHRREIIQSFKASDKEPRSYYGVAFSPDGRRVLATTYERDIWIWDSATGRVLQTLSGHTGYVISAAFSPDGDRVLSASFDQTLRLWNVQTGQEIRTFRGHTAGVRGAVFVGREETALSCSMDGSVRIWSLDGNLRIWSRGSYEASRILAGHDGGVRGVAVTIDGRRAVSAGIDRTLRVWDLTQNADAPIASEAKTVTSLDCAPDDGMVFACGDQTGSVRLRDLATFRVLRAFDGQLGPVDTVTILSGGDRLFAADSAGNCRVWDIMSGDELHRYAGKGSFEGQRTRGEGWSFTAVSRDGRFFLSSQPDHTVVRRMIGSEVGELKRLVCKGRVTCVAVSPDSRYAICGDERGEVYYWQPETGECRLLRYSSGSKSASVDCAAFSADGKHALTSGHDLVVHLWDLIAGEEAGRFVGPTLVVRGVRYGRGDRTVFSVGSDQTLRMWDAKRGRDLRLGAHLPTYSYALAVVPPGDAVLASSGSSISLWDTSRSLCHLDFGARLDGVASALRANPDDGAALLTLGEWYAFRGVNDWALDFLEKARARGADVPSLTLARCYWQLGQTKEAADQFREAIVRREAPPNYLRLCLDAVTGAQAHRRLLTAPAQQNGSASPGQQGRPELVRSSRQGAARP
ncbi:MAG TPA: protein kinase [Phycisphaerae bacterium]|nr:protein kinase [Phycisphaerae bacterium]